MSDSSPPSNSCPDNTPWRFRGQPALVAHRGFARLFPENTLTAIAAAVDAGAQFVEFDIQLSKDKVPFLMHDDDFLRTGGIDSSVFENTMSQISQFNVGEQQRLGGRFNSVKPISLENMCEHLQSWSSVHSFVEIKDQSIDHFGLNTVMEKVLEPLHKLQAPFSVISFHQDVIHYVHKHTQMSTAWVIPTWNQENLNTLKALQPEFVFCNYKFIPGTTPLPEGPWNWVLYEVTDPEIAAHWRQRGAAMVESMAVTSMLDSSLYSANK